MAIPVFVILFFVKGITDIWAISIIPIIVALLFTNNIALVVIASSVVLTQILTWIIYSNEKIESIEPTFIIRLIILLVTLRFAFYINKVYVNRLKENTFIADHDLVTELPNRRFFYERLNKQILIAKTREEEMGMAPISIAVNVSGHQLRNPELIQKMKQVIVETKIDSRYIEVEVTESIAMNQVSDIGLLLFQLKEIGVSIAIDDFGTGYSSLSRLSELPIDVLKIDKKFVDEIFRSDKDRAVIKTIIDLAKNLNLKIVAEGAETKEQVEYLKREECDYIQGYFYFKPLPIEELNKYL